jgi:hypothetical protein
MLGARLPEGVRGYPESFFRVNHYPRRETPQTAEVASPSAPKEAVPLPAWCMLSTVAGLPKRDGPGCVGLAISTRHPFPVLYCPSLTRGQAQRALGPSGRSARQGKPSWSAGVALAGAFVVDCLAFLEEPEARSESGRGVELARGFCLPRAAGGSLIGRTASGPLAFAGRAGRGEFLHRFRPPKRQRFGGGRKGGQPARDGSATAIDGSRSVIDRSGNVIGRSNVAIDCKRLLPIPIISRKRKPMARWQCATCGEWHDGLPLAYGPPAPVHWFLIPEEERERRTLLSSDLCLIDEQHGYIVGNVEIPIIGSEEHFCWDAWVSLSLPNFKRTFELWEQPGRESEPPYFGWLSSRLPGYPETVGLKTMVHTREMGRRPRIELEPTDHPLAVEQRQGITWERVQQIAAFVLHGGGSG